MHAPRPVRPRHIHARIKQIAEANHAQADVRIEKAVPVTVDDPVLTERMIPTLKRIGGRGGAAVSRRVMVAEDFSYFQQEVPGLF